MLNWSNRAFQIIVIATSASSQKLLSETPSLSQPGYLEQDHFKCLDYNEVDVQFFKILYIFWT